MAERKKKDCRVHTWSSIDEREFAHRMRAPVRKMNQSQSVLTMSEVELGLAGECRPSNNGSRQANQRLKSCHYLESKKANKNVDTA